MKRLCDFSDILIKSQPWHSYGKFLTLIFFRFYAHFFNLFSFDKKKADLIVFIFLFLIIFFQREKRKAIIYFFIYFGTLLKSFKSNWDISAGFISIKFIWNCIVLVGGGVYSYCNHQAMWSVFILLREDFF